MWQGHVCWGKILRNKISVWVRTGCSAHTCRTSTSRKKLERSPRATLRATGSSCSPTRAIIFTATSARTPSLFAVRASHTWLNAPWPIRRTSSYESSLSLSGCTSAPAEYTLENGAASSGATYTSGICGTSIVEGDETKTSSGGSMVTNPRREGW